MFYKTEWNTPHTRPAGKTVAEWVECVRRLEETGWLKDPETVPYPDDPDHAAARQERVRSTICHALCWRPRCKRAGRCRHLIPLAIREFQPEFGIHLASLDGRILPCDGPADEAKMTILRELFPAR